MRIQLDKKYWLKSNANEYTLFTILKAKNNKTGEIEESDSPVGHFSRLDQVLRDYAEVKIRTSSVSTLDGLLKYIKTVYADVDKIASSIRYSENKKAVKKKKTKAKK